MKKTTSPVQHLSLGIDISKDKFDVCLMCGQSDKHRKILGSTKFDNHLKGFEKLWEWLSKRSVKHPDIVIEFTMEATGVYHENLAWYLYEQGARVVIVLPNQAKAFMKSEGMKSKNDRIDAEGLAKMSLSKNLRVWKPISPILHRLRTQTRHHSNLQKEITRTGNQIHALEHSHLPDKLTLKQLKKALSFLVKQREEMKKSIEVLVKEDDVFYKRISHLCSIYGVGVLTAATVIAETNGFELFTSLKQLTSYAGYDVVENQSGKRAGKTRISKRGNSHIRRILFMPAFHAVNVEGNFQDLYLRVFERTKEKMKGYVAVQRKLLCLMYTLWKKEEDFDEKKHKKHILVEEDKLPLPEIVSQ